ncbi:hypothetical protein KY308_00940 [Candidatus Woesearchaeota archaeon]|nr:hypothetical protein [Candidatus Woesearchaeota archaeon]
MEDDEGCEVIGLEHEVNCGYEKCSQLIPEGTCLKEQGGKDMYFCDLQCFHGQLLINTRSASFEERRPMQAHIVKIKYE